MIESHYNNADGSPKPEANALREIRVNQSAEKRGVSASELHSLMDQVYKTGYVMIPELVSAADMASIKSEVAPLLQHDGRTEFEGYKTRRIYSVFEKTLALNPLIEHPLVLALLDQVLQDNYLLSQVQAINVTPGEIAQPLHHDDGFYPLQRPRAPISAATIWAIDDFTENNGATRVIPASHRWDGQHPGDGSEHEMLPAVMPAGSVIFFLGTLWHGAGPNNSETARMAATAQYCEPWARQQENYSLAISRERAKLCSETIQEMLGYSMLFPFIGFVNGRDPKRLLKD
ncbi:MAG: phytanoyl-CoA dioxygenase family protein [Pseudomonadales bacterium]